MRQGNAVGNIVTDAVGNVVGNVVGKGYREYLRNCCKGRLEEMQLAIL